MFVMRDFLYYGVGGKLVHHDLDVDETVRAAVDEDEALRLYHLESLKLSSISLRHMRCSVPFTSYFAL